MITIWLTPEQLGLIRNRETKSSKGYTSSAMTNLPVQVCVCWKIIVTYHLLYIGLTVFIYNAFSYIIYKCIEVTNSYNLEGYLSE